MLVMMFLHSSCFVLLKRKKIIEKVRKTTLDDGDLNEGLSIEFREDIKKVVHRSDVLF